MQLALHVTCVYTVSEGRAGKGGKWQEINKNKSFWPVALTGNEPALALVVYLGLVVVCWNLATSWTTPQLYLSAQTQQCICQTQCTRLLYLRAETNTQWLPDVLFIQYMRSEPKLQFNLYHHTYMQCNFQTPRLMYSYRQLFLRPWYAARSV